MSFDISADVIPDRDNPIYKLAQPVLLNYKMDKTHLKMFDSPDEIPAANKGLNEKYSFTMR